MGNIGLKGHFSIFLRPILSFLLRKPRDIVAFVHIFLVCWLHFMSLSMVTPRYLTLVWQFLACGCRVCTDAPGVYYNEMLPVTGIWLCGKPSPTSFYTHLNALGLFVDGCDHQGRSLCCMWRYLLQIAELIQSRCPKDHWRTWKTNMALGHTFVVDQTRCKQFVTGIADCYCLSSVVQEIENHLLISPWMP